MGMVNSRVGVGGFPGSDRFGGCFNWEARRAIGERGTERGRDFVGGG